MAKIIAADQTFLNKPRSSWKYPHSTAGTCRMGQLIPVFVNTDILPGMAIRTPDMKSIIRALTLLNPFFGHLRVNFEWFFVPDRLVYQYAKRVYGENDTTAWYPRTATEWPEMKITGELLANTETASYIIGTIKGTSGVTDAQVSNWFSNTLYGRLLPFVCGTASGSKLSVYPVKAINSFKLVWNRYYRDENLQDPVEVNLNPDSEQMLYDGCLWCLPYTNKQKDFFVGVLPDPQKGPTVEIPIGETADLKYDPGAVGALNYTFIKNSSGNNVSMSAFGGSNTTVGLQGTVSGSSGPVGIDNSAALKVDLSTATAASVRAVRLAVATQQLYEIGARFGTRFPEFINAHFGVDNPSLHFNEPQYLGGWSEPLNVTTVTSTASTSSGELGELGAKSETHTGGHSFVYQAGEFGTLLCLMHINQEHMYPNRIEKQYLRKDLIDTYLPVFNGIGDEPVLKCEMALSLASSTYAATGNLSQVLGYQEYGAAYRFKPNTVTGLLNPYLPSPLGSWTIADKWSSTPVLGPAFLSDSGNEFNRVTVATTSVAYSDEIDSAVDGLDIGGGNGIQDGSNSNGYGFGDGSHFPFAEVSAPQFIYQIDFGMQMIAVMPVTSRPGLRVF